jgi:hypothetical protein
VLVLRSDFHAHILTEKGVKNTRRPDTARENGMILPQKKGENLCFSLDYQGDLVRKAMIFSYNTDPESHNLPTILCLGCNKKVLSLARSLRSASL